MSQLARPVMRSCQLEEAMVLLSGLEKQTRIGCDTYSTARVLVTIVQLNDRIFLFILDTVVRERCQL